MIIFVLYPQNLIFRQAQNLPRLENSLPQQRQEDDLQTKKIRVNAQVTFMISILEMIGFVIGIVVVLIFKSTTLPVIINSMILYLILLPRAFLMNTSHNKSRIIEHGWENILRNTLGLSPKSSSPNSNQEGERVENKTRMSSQITSFAMDNSSPTGTTSILKKSNNEEFSKCKNLQNQKRVQIRMSSPTLERPDQIQKTMVRSISKEMESIERCQGKMDCRTNRSTKMSRLKKDELFMTDLELESENVFSFE